MSISLVPRHVDVIHSIIPNVKFIHIEYQFSILFNVGPGVQIGKEGERKETMGLS